MPTSKNNNYETTRGALAVDGPEEVDRIGNSLQRILRRRKLTRLTSNNNDESKNVPVDFLHRSWIETCGATDSACISSEQQRENY
jgi:hypothetical protein